MEIIKNPVLRIFLFSLGVLAAAAGIVGVFLPVLPTTPFILLAAWCFVRSSKKAHQWIYRQPLIGEALMNWEKNRSISKPTKVAAISMIAFSLVVIWLKVSHLGVRAIVTVVLVGVSVFILSQKSGE